MTKKEHRRLKILKSRRRVLAARVAAAETIQTTEWAQELAAIEWAIQEVERQFVARAGNAFKDAVGCALEEQLRLQHRLVDLRAACLEALELIERGEVYDGRLKNLLETALFRS